MAIVPADLVWKLSVPLGAAGNSSASSGALSLGKYVATTYLDPVALNNLFDDLTGQENFEGHTEYRCIFAVNEHFTLSLQNALVWQVNAIDGGAVIALGVDPTAPSALANAGAQALEIAEDTVAPAGVAFVEAMGEFNGLSLGTIGPRQVKAVWLRRMAQSAGALNLDGTSLAFGGDTAQ